MFLDGELLDFDHVNGISFDLEDFDEWLAGQSNRV